MKPPLDDRIVEQAIQWLVLLRSGSASELDRQRFAAWRDASPAHAEALRHLEGRLGVVALPPVLASHHPTVRHLLEIPRSPMRHVRRALVFGGLGVGVAALVDMQTPLSDLTADMRTATSERRDFTLADGHQIRLNARSAVDVASTGQGHQLRLRRGSVLAVSGSPGDRLRLSSQAGVGECAGGTVCASLDARGGMTVAVLEGAATLSAPTGATALARTGDVRRLDRDGIAPLRLAARTVAAWAQGMVEVEHQPLEDVIAALRPYHAGVIELHQGAGALRVTGRFPLDPHRTLQMLVDTLPIEVRYITGLWIRIGRR